MANVKIRIQNMSGRKDSTVYFADPSVAEASQIIVIPRAGSFEKTVSPQEYSYAKNKQKEFGVQIKII